MRTFFICLLIASPAAAQLHNTDVALSIVDGQITTGARVYTTELGDKGLENEIDDPGFDNLAGTFPTGSSLRLDILDALRKWDGEDFDLIPSETMSLRLLSLGPVFTPAASQVVQGFDVPVSSDGAWHRHYDYVLHGAASDGVYLMQLSLDSNDGGIAASDPFFIVFGQNVFGAPLDTAAEWVEENYDMLIGNDGLPGDFNADGTVDAADYTVWRDGLGSEYEPADYETWRNNFGTTATGGGAHSPASVPEPGGLILLFSALLSAAMGSQLADSNSRY